ncbi:MAG: Rpn family recombination-promoting nuclease/putative transposase [Lachnospiraceae bacterium]|nr:Rpn family recombination-promoting nuclease/putative transposase [Lachnospiraceae bacterium]
MGKEDIKLKTYFENERRYADLWNGAVFGGKEVLKAEQLMEANPVLHQADGQNILERNRDLVMKQSCDGQCYAVFAVENQQTIDYSMPARIMLQEALEYNRQIKAITRKNEFEAKTCDPYHDAGERLYRFRKADLLHPVVTLVVYWGEEEWIGARSLHDMIDFGIGDKSLEEELRKLVPEYPIHFLNISVFERLEYFKTELRPLLELFKRRNSKKLFMEYIEANEAHWNMDDESWYMLSQLTHSKSLSKLIEEKNQREQLKRINIERKEITMCKAIDDLENDARNEGREEGIIIGKAEDILELLGEHGQVPNELKSRIFSQKDIGILRKWLKLAAKTASIQEFAQSI